MASRSLIPLPVFLALFAFGCESETIDSVDPGGVGSTGGTRSIDPMAEVDIKAAMSQFRSFEFSFALPTVDGGKELSSSDLKGKVIIADIWGTWCPPCREEIPHFVELQEKYGKDGLQIVGINYENGDAEQVRVTVQKFMADYKMNYPCVIGDPQTRDQVPGFQGYPTTVFIDRTGKVRLTMVGLQPLERLEAAVSVLLKE